jgi:hypothetical protein
MNGELCGVGPRNKIRGTHEVKKNILSEPTPLLYDFFPHHGNMGRGASEADHSELEKNLEDFRNGNGVNSI